MIVLENNSNEGEAVYGSFTSAAFLVTVSSSAKPQASITFKHLGTAGFWYIKFRRSTGPTTSVYTIKLGPGEFITRDNPPMGDVWLLADGSVNGNLSWALGYAL